MSIARISAGIPAGSQFAPAVRTESALTLPAPSPAKRVPTDRETLDEIATGLAEAREWSSEDLEWIAQTVARTGRPNPGQQLLTDAEAELIEDRGDNLEDAAANRYRQMLAAQRSTPRVPIDPTDTLAVVRARESRAAEANRALELASTKALAQMVKGSGPTPRTWASTPPTATAE